jgi:hypothetical protein
MAESGVVTCSFPACPHGKVRELEPCLLCWESFMLSVKCHSTTVNRLKQTQYAHVPCEHSSEKRRCRVCKGSWVCVHGIQKVYCQECDGRRLCQLCFKKTLPRCYEVCRHCREQQKSLGVVLRSKFKHAI